MKRLFQNLNVKVYNRFIIIFSKFYSELEHPVLAQCWSDEPFSISVVQKNLMLIILQQISVPEVLRCPEEKKADIK